MKLIIFKEKLLLLLVVCLFGGFFQLKQLLELHFTSLGLTHFPYKCGPEWRLFLYGP